MLALSILAVAAAAQAGPVVIGNHTALFSREGLLRPWIPLGEALDREMAWYEKCPRDGKYARCVVFTFMDGEYRKARNRNDSIPAMQSATGILSYVAYDRWTHGRHPWVIGRAREFADYVLEDASTPNTGQWPQFPRSTGKAGVVPQPKNCGCQADHPYDIEPDKGALFGYALTVLYQRTHEQRYLDAAARIAATLAQHMLPGDAHTSPWPFRVDFRTGEPRGAVSADMGYPLALFDALNALGHHEFAEPKTRLWSWIKTYELKSARSDGALWAQFFEDYDMAGNRNSWSPDSLAKLLLKRREAIDAEWKTDARALIDFAATHFVTIRQGVPVCGEQDDDKNPWGGALSTYGAALALYARATGDPAYKSLARQALNFASYAVADDGCPGQTALYPVRGGWQEDAHTDVVHNLVDALEAFPDWATLRG